MTDPLPLPDGFRLGHWTDAEARTGCTVVIAPPGSRDGVDIRGGGTGTGLAASWRLAVIGAVAATVTASAIRDAVSA